jgi:hypothetical protein
MKTPGIYTCGYGDSGRSKSAARREPGSLDGPDALASLVTRLDATLVDVRAFPGPVVESDVVRTGARVRYASGRVIYTRRGFWRIELSALLGARYEWRGDRLGGDWGGSPGPTPAGIAELAADVARGRRLVLMCSEAGSASCHRHHLIEPRLPALRFRHLSWQGGRWLDGGQVIA